MHHPTTLPELARHEPARLPRHTLARYARRIAHLAAAALLRRVLRRLLDLLL